MWESPIYKFRKTIREAGEHKKLTIDVTGSAPTMASPGKTLEGVFNTLTQKRTPNKTKILDVGAAKLRNTIYLLRKGFLVYAVEFEELAKKMRQARENWDKAREYPNFKQLIFPKDFFAFKDKVDITLLINVTNVMPIPTERLTLVSLCREKMNPDGLILWYNWMDIGAHPDNYTDSNKINDGFFKGAGRASKTFHGEWSNAHVFDMLIASGFSPAEEVSLPDTGSNQAFVFKADQPRLLDEYLELEAVKSGRKKTDPEKLMSETGPICFPEVYLGELDKVQPGSIEQVKFHRICARLLANIFDHQLKNPVIEHEIRQGRGRVDLKFHTQNKPGFFKDLTDMRDVLCPSVFVECKNYRGQLGNPEFNQLADRLNRLRGQFGLLICRKITDRRETIRQCHDRITEDGKYIVVLDDRDMKELARRKLHINDEDVDEYMTRKLEEVID